MDILLKNKVLKDIFGYDSFIEGQETLIDNILSGNDVLGIMPTGAGKSLCYQVPALVFDGITIVISPLIALMKDQVGALVQTGVRAAFLNSSLTMVQYRAALSNAERGVYKIIYVAPERLESDDFLRFAAKALISMVAVDEAHCISQWGQDFRPNYLKIIDFINILPKRPVIGAFTATATTRVKEDIISALELKNPKVLITGFDRKNLYFDVRRPENKFDALMASLAEKQRSSGVIYCSTRKAVDSVHEKLNERGFSVTKYHAGLTDYERKSNQDDFILDKKPIIVATNAFGMGIDKSNVSFVIHYNMPKNIESYYQEAGRAGRDGQPADCILLFGEQDVQTNLALIDSSSGREYTNKESELQIKQQDRDKLRIMTSYCRTTECLRQYILSYFGEASGDNCGNCSNCVDEFETIDVTVEAQKILSCIYRSKERYGIRVIIDTLRGKRNEKVLNFGLDKLTTFGIMNESEKQIREIINCLIEHKYILITNDEYPIAKLGTHAQELLFNKQRVMMKTRLSDKHTPEASSKTKTKSAKKPVFINPVNQDLLTRLKELRLSLAHKQGVPAYVIFSDTTLIDICSKLPESDEEFLNISGVGQVKLERYGKDFIDAVNNFVSENNIKRNTQSVTTEDFHITQPIPVEISSEPVTISVVTDKINVILLQKIGKKTSGQKINEWLVNTGYLYVEDSKKLPTDKGKAIGIMLEYREPSDRAPFYVSVFNRDAQQFLIDKVDDIADYICNTVKQR